MPKHKKRPGKKKDEADKKVTKHRYKPTKKKPKKKKDDERSGADVIADYFGGILGGAVKNIRKDKKRKKDILDNL